MIIIIVVVIIITITIIIIISSMIILNIILHYPPIPPNCLGPLAGVIFFLDIPKQEKFISCCLNSMFLWLKISSHLSFNPQHPHVLVNIWEP